jgi:hypothetical protein
MTNGRRRTGHRRAIFFGKVGAINPSEPQWDIHFRVLAEDSQRALWNAYVQHPGHFRAMFHVELQAQADFQPAECRGRDCRYRLRFLETIN